MRQTVVIVTALMIALLAVSGFIVAGSVEQMQQMAEKNNLMDEMAAQVKQQTQRADELEAQNGELSAALEAAARERDEALEQQQALAERLAQSDAQRVQEGQDREALLQEAEALADAERLRRVWSAEQKDVEDLGRLSFASIAAKLSGRGEERLEREEAEACAARMKYDAAERQLAEIQQEIAGCEAELRADQGCEARFQQVLEEKREALKLGNSAAAERIIALEERMAELQSRLRELEEARSAGEDVRRRLDQVLASLGSAENWGTWDVIGGGLLTDMMKYSRLDEAQHSMEQMQSALRRYRRELADVAALHIGDFRPDGFTWTLDVLFDNIFFDWSVLEQISNSRDRVEDLRRQVGRTQGQLNLEFNQVCRERDAVCRELDHLVETA